MTKAGLACPATTTRTPDSGGKFYCFQHHPDVDPEQRRLSRTKGGLESVKARFLPPDCLPAELGSPAGVKAFLQRVADAVVRGQLAPASAQAAVSAANAAVRLAELVVASQLQALEDRIAEREQGRG